jgi:hypothetical protein
VNTNALTKASNTWMKASDTWHSAFLMWSISLALAAALVYNVQRKNLLMQHILKQTGRRQALMQWHQNGYTLNNTPIFLTGSHVW